MFKIFVTEQNHFKIDLGKIAGKNVGQILNEIILQIHTDKGVRKFCEHGKIRRVIGLCSRSGCEGLDFWLTQPGRTLNVLHPDDELQLLFSDYVQQKRVPHLTDFEVIKVIGKGGFSKVLEVRKKDNGLIYAMKVISKDFVLRNRKVEQIMAERRILSKSNHPFLVRLHYAFQTRNYLFLVLDFCPGGELFFHLHKLQKFSEAMARHYLAEVVLAIEYLHQHQILYRDLKPENVLLDIDGHIKLTDFGLSKENFGAGARSYSFCGSPEYLSPEMLLRNGHDQGVDFYSLGALLYEMLTGLPPHYSRDRQEMYRRIIQENVVYPPSLSIEAISLMQKLLCKNPKHRLTISQIKRHKFFRGIAWNEMLLKSIKAPLKLNPRYSFI